MSTMRRDQKIQQESKSPSFSSTLLDEIYRSMDESDQRTAKPIVRKKQSNVPLKNTGEDEIANFRSARLVEQWVEKKATEKMVSRKQEKSPEFQRKSKCENDAQFFSSSSCSSDSSSGQFSSSETEITSTKSSKKKVTSCFTKGMPKPKPIRTKVPEKSARTEKTGDALFCKKQSQTHEDKQGVIKSKLKALNIYDSLKQPISPGARISTFLNSVFATKNSKKTKNSTFNGSFREMGMEKTPKTPSTAPSFTRSCLSKKSPSIRENTRTNGVQRTVKFVNEDCRQVPIPILRKSSTLRRDEEVKFQVREKNRAALDVLKHYREKNNGDYRVNYEDYVNDDDDAASDCSSDLFELDHHKFSGKNDKNFCEELPVYGTTHVVTNRAIAKRM